MKKNHFVGAALAALLCSGASFAASDLKEEHGSSCKLSGIAPEGTGTLWAYGVGEYCYSPTCWLICPVTRDKFGDVDNIASAHVEIRNQRSDELWCYFETYQDDGSSGVMLTGQSDYTASTGRQQLQFSSSILDANSGNEGSYYLECFLNEDDILYEYRTEETTDLGGYE